MNQFNPNDKVVIYDEVLHGVKATVTRLFFGNTKEYIYQLKLDDGRQYFAREEDLTWES